MNCCPFIRDITLPLYYVASLYVTLRYVTSRYVTLRSITYMYTGTSFLVFGSIKFMEPKTKNQNGIMA